MTTVTEDVPGPDGEDAAAGCADETGYHAAWRQQVLARARRLELALHEHAPAAEVRRDVQALLKVACDAAKARPRLRDWWEGTLVERAWLSLHEAEVLLVQHMSPARGALWWQETTRMGGAQRLPWEAGARPGPLPPQSSYAIAHSLRAFLDDSDRTYEEARTFRNQLIRLTVIGLVMTALMLGAGGTGMLHVPGPAPDKPPVVDGVGQFLLVALFGAVGAFVTSLSSLSRTPARRTPFQLPLHQLTLKLVVGPVFALLGVLAIQAQFVQQVQAFDRFGATLLLWAAVFGGAQQAVTGVFDRRAASIAKAAPGSPSAVGLPDDAEPGGNGV